MANNIDTKLKNSFDKLKIDITQIKESIYRHSQLMEEIVYNQNALLHRIEEFERKDKKKK